MRTVTFAALGFIGCTATASNEPALSPERELELRAYEQLSQERDEARAAAERDAAGAEERQEECRIELSTLETERAQAQQARAGRDALASCASSGIPAGTYKTATGLPHVELEVTADGCAAYEAFTRVDEKHVRTHDEVPYLAQGWECTVGGTLTADRKPKHARFAGDCRRKLFDVLSEEDAWSFTAGASPSVTVTTSEPTKRKVVLQRTSADVALAGDLPRLWSKQRIESDGAARVSVALASGPKPGMGVGCAGLPLGDPGCAPPTRDYCAELATARASESK